METEAHVYALAVSASVLLSFYPFLTVMLSFCRNILHWPAAVQAIYVALDDYFPGDLGVFVRRNAPHSSVEIGSMFLLLLTANGVFEPLEVALNRAWGVERNRPYWRNQLVALGMIFACGSLALLSLMFTALNRKWVNDWAGGHAGAAVWLNLVIFKLAALPLSILALFGLLAVAEPQDRSSQRMRGGDPHGNCARSVEVPQPRGVAIHAGENQRGIRGIPALGHDFAMEFRGRPDRAGRRGVERARKQGCGRDRGSAALVCIQIPWRHPLRVFEFQTN
jgi:hypothetical protein